jgi:hypothetical protein
MLENIMKNKTYFGWFAFGFLAVVAVVFAGYVVLQGRQSVAVDARPMARTPVPDSVLVMPPADGSGSGDEIVENSTAGYYFSMPSNWYVEKNAGAGIAIYPDYDPSDASSSPAECKIEIAGFSGAGGVTDLNSWVTGELHADPTADISEDAQTNLEIGSSSAIEWQGTMNGVSTTLVYVLSGGNVFEIAPSTLSSGDGSGDDAGDCNLELQALVTNLHFGNYEN